MTLVLSQAVIDQMYRHAQADYPREACGILVGRMENGHRQVAHIVETPNIEPTRQRDRFVMDPQVLLRVFKDTRGSDQAVVGYYHSHPDHPCEPSPTDFQFAADWADHAFLIVEVRDQVAVRCRSWVVADGADWFEEEPVEVT